jgi:5-hydroxyisourate hydrolase-like protein (transthyretin family)
MLIDTFTIAKFVLTSLLLQSNPSAAVQHGSISGTLANDSGSPVANVKISAERPGDPRVVASTQSDANGRFRLEVDLGKYLIIATDERGIFADCNLRIFSCDIPQVEVSSASPAINVVVTTRKAGRVQGTIKDRGTGVGIGNVTIVVHRGDDYFNIYNQNASSTFSFAVPAGVDLTLAVGANKYRQWIYRSPTTDYATFRASAGENVVLNVEMVQVDP